MKRNTLCGLGVALVLAAPAVGDWLVLRDGTRLETAGPWKVKGRQVVFTRPGGALAALRLADVDLESSTAATDPGEPKAVEPSQSKSEVVRRPSVLVLTNDDLQPGSADAEAQSEAEVPYEEGDEGEGDASEDDADGGDDAGSDDAAPATASGNAAAVAIVSWHEQESSAVDGLEIVGAVRNRSRDVATGIRVQVKVSDEDGAPVIDTRAFLQKASLAPDRTSTFRVLLPGIYALFEDPTFEVTSERFSMDLATEPEDGSDEEFADEADAADDLEDFSYESDESDELEPLDDEQSGGSG